MSNTRRLHAFALTFVGIGCCGTLPCARAQSTAAAADQSGLAEIIVTAERRQENLQSVPISVQVLAGQTLEQQNLNSLEEVAEVVPSVHINGTGSGGQIFIRGIGSGTNATFDQSVGIFIDDIYHGRAHTSGATFLDLDRIEILKGPQSTFFGNNAIGGALNIVSKKPDDTFEGYARALYGQFGQYVAEGAVNVPLSDTFAVRFAGTVNGLNGWQKNPYAGHDQSNDDNQAGRVSLLFKPSENFDAALKVEASSNTDHDGSQIGDCPPPAPFVAAGFCKSALASGLPVGINSTYNTTGAGQGVDLSTFEDVLTLNYRALGHTFTSVTGFYNYHSQQNVDADGTPATLLNIQIAEKYHQFSQELRVSSPTDQTFEYLGGVYFQTDRIDGRPTDLSYFFLSPTFESKPAFAPLLPYLPIGSSGDYSQVEHSYAIFGSLGWNITEQLKVSAGVRGSWVYKSQNTNNFYGTATESFGGIVPLPAGLQALPAAVLGAQSSSSASRSDSDWIPSAKIQYTLAPAVMAYFSYANGFKAGVPSGGTVGGIPAPPIAPEHVNAYEAGLKSEWFDHRVLLNADVFRSDYRDLQVSTGIFTSAGAFVPLTQNAATSRSQGVELEGQWVMSSDFRLSTNVTYLDSHYIRYPNVTLTSLQSFCRSNAAVPDCAVQFPAGVPAAQDLSGRPTGFAPRVSGSLTATYSTALPKDYKLTTEASALFSSSYFYANNGTDDDLLNQSGYARLDTRVSLETPDRRWAFDVIGKNLTDKIIIAGGTGGTSLPSSLGSTLLRKEEPRNFAFQVRYHW
jgi:iron complex outermembrane recepter protein